VKYDFLIAGAGVAGLSLAFHLSAAGKRIFVFEREALPGAHASGKNAGMFRHLYRNETLTFWAEQSRALWPDELISNFTETGSLVVGRKVPTHHPKLFNEVAIAQTANSTSLPAVFCTRDGLLDSPSYVNALFKLCRKNGVQFHFRFDDYSVSRADDEWTFSTKRTAAEGKVLVNAAGAWSQQLLESAAPGNTVELQPYARHLFLIGGWPEGYMPAAGCGFYWNEQDGWYLRRWDRDTRLFSICDAQPAHPERYVPDESVRERVASALLRSFPELSPNLTVLRSWHCFRTYANDQLPVIGPDPTISEFFWMAGFGGFGMSTAFGAAFDAARLLSGAADAIPAGFEAARVRGLSADSGNFTRLARVS